MVLVAIATRWWWATCMRCGINWGPWLEELESEPYCSLCNVWGMVYEEFTPHSLPVHILDRAGRSRRDGRGGHVLGEGVAVGDVMMVVRKGA